MTCQLICKCEWINVNVNIELTIINCNESCTGGWCRTSASCAHLWDICRSKASKFPYFSKGKLVSAWLISKSSGIFLYKSSFCASNSWPAFCLFSCSSLITQRRRSMSSARNYWEKKCLLRWNMDIYLTKMHGSLQEAFIHHPEPCEARFITDACTLFHVFWTVDKKHAYPHCKAWRGQDNF